MTDKGQPKRCPTNLALAWSAGPLEDCEIVQTSHLPTTRATSQKAFQRDPFCGLEALRLQQTQFIRDTLVVFVPCEAARGDVMYHVHFSGALLQYQVQVRHCFGAPCMNAYRITRVEQIP